jgi:hypothetical protein
MNSIGLLQVQFNSINALLNGFGHQLTDVEWTARMSANTDLPGFICWHIARTQDWGVHTVIRGVPEVIHDPRWRNHGGLTTPGIGAGFTRAEADQIAMTVSRQDCLAYGNAVHESIRSWLSTLGDADLDRTPDMATHQAAYPEYQRQSFQDEIRDLIGKPAWRILLGPRTGHIRLHLGELDLLSQLARSSHHP